jgi:molybdopterin/thiamine biosynthesis adenylyltransferase
MLEPQVIKRIKRKLVLNDEDIKELSDYNRARFYGQSGVRMAIKKSK